MKSKEQKQVKIWYHADDFGINMEQSKSILECYQKGCLNSISIITNTDRLEEVGKLLRQADPTCKLRRILHLNFVEGHALAPKEQVSMLVDEKGMFCCSFMKLFLKDLLLRGKKREVLKKQIKTEILAQLDALLEQVDQVSGMDAHQHYHMIPVVFEALCEALDERPAFGAHYIRIPLDSFGPVLSTQKVWKKLKPINVVKWCILRLHAGKIKKELKRRQIEIPAFFGIFFTCEMTQDVVQALLDKYKACAEKKSQALELMFHPGALKSREELLDPASEELYEFYLSKNRMLEKSCLVDLTKE